MNEDQYNLPPELFKIGELILKYIQHDISAEEQIRLDNWIHQSSGNRQLFDSLISQPELQEKLKLAYEIDKYKEADTARMMEMNFPASIHTGGKLVSLWRRVAVAVCLVLPITIAGYILFINDNKQNIAGKDNAAKNNLAVNDVAPGQYKARLTLSDGKTVELTTTASGQLATQGNTHVINKNGQLIYEAPGASPSGEARVRYNTLTTAKGEMYPVVLSDGSTVWLNSGSSLRYPVVFIGSERKVEVRGEAFFKVAKNAAMPFKVNILSASGKDMGEVEVLGTEFNVQAYDDEAAIRTTLAEGSVKYTVGNKNVKLIPGQQAAIPSSIGGGREEAISVLDNANIEAITAWKNQTFYFKSADLKSVMRQLVRWYDVDVKYEGNIPERSFSGQVSRNRNLSEVLKMLELADIHFKINDKTIIVLP